MRLNPLPDLGPLIDHGDLHGCRWGSQMAPAMDEEGEACGMCLATVASTQDASFLTLA